MIEGLLAVYNGEAVPVSELPPAFLPTIYWTVDFRFERLDWQVVAWSMDRSQLFEYRFDENTREEILRVLPMLGYDAVWRFQ
jgi:hypothetical protein